MNNKQAINLVQQQFKEAKLWFDLLKEQQTEEEMQQAFIGILAMGIVLDLAKKQIEEEEQ